MICGARDQTAGSAACYSQLHVQTMVTTQLLEAIECSPLTILLHFSPYCPLNKLSNFAATASPTSLVELLPPISAVQTPSSITNLTA